jgi:hypothetical protein
MSETPPTGRGDYPSILASTFERRLKSLTITFGNKIKYSGACIRYIYAIDNSA